MHARSPPLRVLMLAALLPLLLSLALASTRGVARAATVPTSTPQPLHRFAPCRDRDSELHGYPDARILASGESIPIAAEARMTCAAAAAAGACGWSDARSVYLRPWRHVCPFSCGLCNSGPGSGWRAVQPEEHLGDGLGEDATNLDTESCHIPRVSVSTKADEERVRLEFIEKSRPVIVEGLVRPETWALTRWVDRAVSADDVMDSEQDANVVRFLQNEWRRVQHLGFNQYGNLDQYGPDLLATGYEAPGTILGAAAHDATDGHGDLIRSTCGTDWTFHWILVAARGVSTAPHVDQLNTTAWNTLLRGRKLWVLGEPSRFPPGLVAGDDGENYARHVPSREAMRAFDYETTAQNWGEEMPWTFARSDLSKAHSRYFERSSSAGLRCVLRPSETIFVPSGWWHAVYNTEASIAITENVANVASLTKVMTELLARPRGSRPWNCAKSIAKKHWNLMPAGGQLYRFGGKAGKLPLKWRKNIERLQRKAKRKGIHKLGDGTKRTQKRVQHADL